ncbi:MAG: tetratricopeptide repeat protein [Thermoguttaceae bacterium]|jgi:TolA-binding protein
MTGWNAHADRARMLVLVASAALLTGCNSVPPAPPSAAANQQAAGNGDQDGYNGWLFKSLTRHDAQPVPAGAASAAPPIPAVAPAAAYPNAPPYPDVVPPAGYPNGDPRAMRPGAAPLSAAPGMYGAPPQNAPSPYPGAVPIGATGTGPASRDVVPASAVSPIATAPDASGTPVTTPVMMPATPLISAPGGADAAKDKKDKSDDDGFDWSKLSPDNMWKDIKQKCGYGPDEKIAHAEFQQGEALFKQKKYEEAGKHFYIASWRWPDSTLEEDALFLLAECYFFADQYSKAHDAYTNLLKKHDNTRYLDTTVSREFAIGRYWEQLDIARPHWPTTPNFNDKTRPVFDTFGNALAAYEAVRIHDPLGPLADYAVMSIANAYFRRGRWEEAAYHYDLIRKDYPKSKFQRDAHVLGVQARLRVYQGPVYDATPLNQAGETADQALTQFRGRLGEEEQNMLKTRAEIIEQKAEREWNRAAYYDKHKFYGAAREHYQSIIKEYPQTDLAQKARERMAQIRDEPDNPPKHFEWLTQLFERKD